MSKHWNPNDDVARGRFGGRGRLRPPDAFDQLSRAHGATLCQSGGTSFRRARRPGCCWSRQRARRDVVIDSAFGRPDVFAEELEQDAGAWNAIQAP